MVVLANYLFEISGKAGTDWQVKGVALAGYTIAVLCNHLIKPSG